MLLAGGMGVLILVAGVIFQLRGPARPAGPPADAGRAVQPPADAQPLAARPARDAGMAARRPPSPRTQWPTETPADAAKPPMGGFDKWTGDEFYRPDEIKEAARARGVSLALFRESKRAFWLTQLTLEWSVLVEMGVGDSREVRATLAKLSTTTHDEVERLLTAASKNEVSEADARARMRRLEDDYRKQYCQSTGMAPEAFERFFEPSLVPQP
jgi:hypothetical protein